MGPSFIKFAFARVSTKNISDLLKTIYRGVSYEDVQILGVKLSYKLFGCNCPSYYHINYLVVILLLIFRKCVQCTVGHKLSTLIVLLLLFFCVELTEPSTNMPLRI